MRRRISYLVLGLTVLMGLSAEARVKEMVVTRVESPTFGGLSFGDVGPYERLEGVMKCEVDPRATANAQIVNLDKAPLNSEGLVEFDTDFVILKPVELKRGNRKIFFDTPNRGGFTGFNTLNGRSGLATSTAASAGNGFLMEQGYTIVATGWQAPYPIGGIPSFFVGLGSRLPPGSGLMARLPVARQKDGGPIVATSREEYFDPPFNLPAPDGTFTKYLTYPAASLLSSDAVLTVKAHEKAARVPIPEWRYVDEWRIKFAKPAGYDLGAIYEFVYPAKDPLVYGLGYAAIRDVVSFLRHEVKDAAGNRNPLQPTGGAPIKAALGFGASQTGRIIKTFVYEGFNQDEKGKIVFDGVNTHIGASRRNWLNDAFSHPGDIFGADQFPFTYAESQDHFTGATGSVLAKCEASHSCPKIFHTDSESEIWSSGASLVVTDTTGSYDLALPDNVRAYLFTGAKHGSGGSMSPGPSNPGNCQQLINPLDYSPLSRALLVRLDEWVTNNVPPPASRYPNLTDGTLTTRQALAFPEIPSFSYGGITLPAANYNGLYLGAYWLDYGVQPPDILGEYPVYVMNVDEDGNGAAGVRLPAIQAPVGTYTGWNRTKPGVGGDDRLCTASGSFFPFALSQADREASGDPRPSLEERYPTHEAYVSAVAQAAAGLVDERLLLPADAEKIVAAAQASTIGGRP